MKQSIGKAIKAKQSSAYAGQRSTSAAIHQIDGSSKREVSRRTTKPIRSFSGSSSVVPSQDMLDKAAEKILTAGYTKKRNPICSSCFSQKSTSGSCNCEL
jgi:hypothetical protein